MYWLNKTNKNKDPIEFCAYCEYHKVGLTVSQLRIKKCLNKLNIGNVCPHLKKNEAHTFWKQRNKIQSIKEKRDKLEKLFYWMVTSEFKNMKIGLNGSNCEKELIYIRNLNKGYLLEDEMGNELWFPKNAFNKKGIMSNFGKQFYYETIKNKLKEMG